MRLSLWDMATRKQLHRLQGQRYVDVAVFSLDGKILASSSDRTILLWDVTTGQVLCQFENYRDGIVALAFAPNGKILASWGQDAKVKLWNVETGQLLH
jgi:WD40 repeat protein